MRKHRSPISSRPRPRRISDLSPRQREVLSLLVRQYLSSARPVASQALAVEGGFAWAPATLRQTMLELEEQGLLEQPHSAAGRIPSDRGYRLYVDALEAPEPLDEGDREAVERVFAQSARDVESLLHQASKLLADLGHELGFAIAPALDESALAGLELVHLGERRVLLVLALDGGQARSMTLELTSRLERHELDRVVSLLRERLLGQKLVEVRRRLAGDEALRRDSLAALIAAACYEALVAGLRREVFVGGAGHVSRHPEFRESTRLRPVLELIDRAERWRGLVPADEPEGLSVTIGRENRRRDLAHLSMVSYRLPGPAAASVGILGPTRMDYARAIGIVEFVGKRLAALF